MSQIVPKPYIVMKIALKQFPKHASATLGRLIALEGTPERAKEQLHKRVEELAKYANVCHIRMVGFFRRIVLTHTGEWQIRLFDVETPKDIWSITAQDEKDAIRQLDWMKDRLEKVPDPPSESPKPKKLPTINLTLKKKKKI